MATSIDVKVNSFLLSGLVEHEDFNVLPEFPENVIPPENPYTSIRIARNIVVALRTDDKYLNYQEIEAKMQMLVDDKDTKDSKQGIQTFSLHHV
ncbi:MAG: hypothetical protein EZS28_021287 [Streblomastix strix]|uniref:Uncharacterized protein n=1 Tax=Streblomastix strix TaxID=222440 RepID=A0A5J4VKL3_9EUKA|nr:MAG: hypothetical protein EZS28_021287 [Streblomastix strix]